MGGWLCNAKGAQVEGQCHPHGSVQRSRSSSGTGFEELELTCLGGQLYGEICKSSSFVSIVSIALHVCIKTCNKAADFLLKGNGTISLHCTRRITSCVASLLGKLGGQLLLVSLLCGQLGIEFMLSASQCCLILLLEQQSLRSKAWVSNQLDRAGCDTLNVTDNAQQGVRSLESRG